MSAGGFVDAVYQSTELAGSFMPIRVQPETLALSVGGTANAGSETAINLPLRVNVSASSREYGVKPRRVVVRFTDEANLPDGYTGEDLSVPVLTQAAYAAYTVGATGTYLTKPVQILARLPERAR